MCTKPGKCPPERTCDDWVSDPFRFTAFLVVVIHWVIFLFFLHTNKDV